MSEYEHIAKLMEAAAEKIASLSKDEEQRRNEILAATHARAGEKEVIALDLCVHTFQSMRKMKALLQVLPKPIRDGVSDDLFRVVSHTCSVALRLVHPDNPKAATEMSEMLRTLLRHENEMFTSLEIATTPVLEAIMKQIKDDEE